MAKMGRPKGTNNKDVNYTVRMDEQTVKRLLAYCRLVGKSRSEVIRQAIDLVVTLDKDNPDSSILIEREYVEKQE